MDKKCDTDRKSIRLKRKMSKKRKTNSGGKEKASLTSDGTSSVKAHVYWNTQSKRGRNQPARTSRSCTASTKTKTKYDKGVVRRTTRSKHVAKSKTYSKAVRRRAERLKTGADDHYPCDESGMSVRRITRSLTRKLKIDCGDVLYSGRGLKEKTRSPSRREFGRKVVRSISNGTRNGIRKTQSAVRTDKDAAADRQNRTTTTFAAAGVEKMPTVITLAVAYTGGDYVTLIWDARSDLDAAFGEIGFYQLYVRQENSAASAWHKKPLIAALPLPMVCRLTHFPKGYTYRFALRPVDVFGRRAPLATAKIFI